MLISEEYRQAQISMHRDKGYGMSGGKHVEKVRSYTDILDYGCGKMSLQESLGFEIHNYDPAIQGLENNNQPHEFVYCGDVLEHIEPEHLDDVLRDIRRCALKAGLLIIATRPSNKSLPDGRNAHLTVKDADWWRTEISKHFTIKNEEVVVGEYIVWV